MTKHALTQDRLKELLDYDPETGVFRWKASKRYGHNGKIAGKIGGGTYRYASIGIDGHYHGIARLAWLFVHGKWPEKQLRFLNGDASDAKISNLIERIAKKQFKQGAPTKNRALPFFKSSRYGITPDQYAEMLRSQKGVCAICEQPETRILRGVVQILCIDHDHTTGNVRALLCNACNVGIGHLRDDPGLVAKAAAYLRRHRGEEFDNVVPLKLVANGDKT